VNYINRDVFEDTLMLTQENATSMDNFSVNLNYQFNFLWISMSPTLWVWAISVVGATVLVLWRRPRTPIQVAATSAGLRLLPDDVKSFVDSYDEKMKIEAEIDLLEERVRKGRIPRPRYKIQKRTFETRLATLDRTLADIGGRMHSAGGHYSDLMRQLEVAETEIDEVETSISSIEARLGRGEISMETYRKLMGDYERRKERARTNVSGILVRLREEIR
jgi:predicted  nucleic acid-binding Zn-ribbon protein